MTHTRTHRPYSDASPAHLESALAVVNCEVAELLDALYGLMAEVGAETVEELQATVRNDRQTLNELQIVLNVDSAEDLEHAARELVELVAIGGNLAATVRTLSELVEPDSDRLAVRRLLEAA